MKKSFKKCFLTVFLVTLGLFFSGYGVFRIINARKCKDWTVLKGRIMDSSIVEISDYSNNNSTETSLPDIKYEYKCNDITYFNDNIGYYGRYTLGLSDSYYAGTEDQIANFVSKYPINSSVDVYVNQGNASESVLDTDLKLPVFMPFLFGVLLVFAGFHIFMYGNFYIPDTKK
jgi:uncharacterized protein DUF3592